MPTYANISGTQKTIGNWYANIGGAQKQLQSLHANIGGASKEIYSAATDYWSIPYKSTKNIPSTTSYSRMASTSVTVDASGTFTLQNATSVKGRPTAGNFVVHSATGSSTATTGTTLYYVYNSTGGCYEFTVAVSNASANAVQRVTAAYSTDVAYDTSSNKLLLKQSIIPSYYRWDYYKQEGAYELESQGSGSNSAFLIEWDDDVENETGVTFSYNTADEYEIDETDGEVRLVDPYFNTDTGYVTFDTSAGSADGTYSIINPEVPYREIKPREIYALYEGLSWTVRRETDTNPANSSTTNYYVTIRWDDAYWLVYDTSYVKNGYVYSPSASAYTEGNEYKNKTMI